ncbi:MAG: saccharopine dehydrogenase NADP-binding domain-containing protein [Bacteroidetes bacterium]|nr:saccharopine dehydrogenase NADP-binding domain-containing protein [Bacteroidota bacterium]MCW5894811.1 saccharopine dehydrogenase NADP-binding domain-containing protein [Bacteroidota bacterium]
MKYTIIGAGMMGSAAAYDLAKRNPDDEIVLADINIQQARSAAMAIGDNVTPVRVDVNSSREVGKLIEGSGAVISAVTYSVNYQMTKAAIEAGVPMCDLGGNNDVVERQLSLDAAAKEKDITVVPNCGLAPGLINILAMEGTREFEQLDSIHLRVGGLPQRPRPPLYYQIVFSVEGLINEYVEKATVIRDGKTELIDPMSGLEDIEFPEPFGTLEAFNTSGGLSTLTQLLDGKVNNLDYKTIRYKGHCEKFKTLLDLGFATSEPMMVGGSVKTNREFFADLLRKKLDYGDKDVVLARATISGRTATAAKTLVYEFVDYYDDAGKMTAMMRTTAFPTSIVAQMLAHGIITERGVCVPEVCVPGKIMIDELGKRNINITKKVTEVWS